MASLYPRASALLTGSLPYLSLAFLSAPLESGIFITHPDVANCVEERYPAIRVLGLDFCAPVKEEPN